MIITPERIKKFQTKILSWYSQHKRDLPWRKTRDPYSILLSEIMLQQTQVSRVIPKYEAWLLAFPTIADLAKAKTADILRLWSGLGYNRRALYLQKTAQAIVKDYKGVWPQTVDELKKLPGIGEYTARAVACFAFGQQVAVVDTNVKKVILVELLRVTKGPHSAEATRGKQSDKETKDKEVQEIAERLLPDERAYDWNQALMDYASAMLKKEKIAIPKQSKFVGSNRYYRGKLLRALLAEHTILTSEVGGILKDDFSEKDTQWLSDLLKGMEKDGLIKKEGANLFIAE